MTPSPDTSDSAVGRVRVWAPRLLLAAVFLYAGADKLSDSRLWARVFTQIGLGGWFRPFTAAVELTGALLLVMPGRTRLGVLLLSCAMLGALVTHVLVVGVGPQTVVVVALLALLSVVWRGTHA